MKRKGQQKENIVATETKGRKAIKSNSRFKMTGYKAAILLLILMMCTGLGTACGGSGGGAGISEDNPGDSNADGQRPGSADDFNDSDVTSQPGKDEKEDRDIKDDDTVNTVDTAGKDTSESASVQTSGAGNGTTYGNTDHQAAGDIDFSIFDNSLFIGDSRTEGFKLYSGVTNASYFCGKSMSIVSTMKGEKLKIDGKEQTVFDVIDNGSFDKIFLCMGLNDLGWNYIDTFLDGYRDLVAYIKEKQPDAVIYIEALLPVTQSKSQSSKTVNNEQIYWYNVNLVDLASELSVNYVNCAEAVVNEDGALPEDCTSDGVHFKSAYYKDLAAYLAQAVQ